MELTAEIFIFYMALSGVVTFVVGFILIEYQKRKVLKKFKGFERFADLASVYMTDSSNDTVIEGAFNSITQLGTLALNANAILDDEEAFNAILSTIASRVMQSFKMSLMGTVSGDGKKLAKAERIVNEAMIKGVQEFSPALKILLKVTGLQEELDADPELFPLIMQVVTKNDGLMNMFSGMMSGAGSPAVQGTQAQEQLVRDSLGIEF